ncbi:prolyl oligopeptidase family serine peptidase [Winogradskyella sp. SYSU M77433]|uniref:prolyl oligopeptidase family serine peptidase n=1 Tax=Winogradskyella sp. SYSU M77433 TaxID=3042722 RepID=UPI0024802FC9|nr:prolyl oligopeptidase family serine peptidase [Winogradskyella sp. SYSU M77433]MDH7914616.1 prolyl oligopeptidase family serine peptidase [Winogradskyella sp. SYSU M77433]
MDTNSKTMRLILFITGLLISTISYGQTSLKEIGLKAGKYKVGFKHYTVNDSTRTYRIHNEFNNQLIERPIPISIWYPTKGDDNDSKQLTVLNYLEILKEEEEWKNLPNYFLLDWFPYLWNTPENKAHLSEKTNAFSNPAILEGKFPVVVYAPSYQASSIENFALFEYLASNGFVVISSPSRGTETRWLEGGTTKDMETQSRDVEFILKEIVSYENIDSKKVALMGFSFGGLSNAITVMKNKTIKAIISLDGTERYNYPVLEKSPYFNLDKFSIPYIHFAQKEIPKEVLTTEKIPEELNYKFQLYDSLEYSNIHRYRFHDLTHSYFSSFGVLFANRDKRQDKSDVKIMASYNLLCQHTLHFLNATLKSEKKSIDFIENKPVANGFSNSLISKESKKAIEKDFTYRDFNDLAFKQDYEDLITLYTKTISDYPNLELKEGMLNTLGLRLSFNPEKKGQGYNVFLLALHIYPKSANLYDSLAEAYLHNKDFKNAISNYEKSLELNPENQNAIDRLKQIKE